jgi:hypothetical protein
MPAEVEAAVCELRPVHPRWGQRRLRHELGRTGCQGPVPSEASIYRRLVRRGLIEAKTGAGGERTTGAGNGPGRCSCGSWT